MALNLWKKTPKASKILSAKPRVRTNPTSFSKQPIRKSLEKAKCIRQPHPCEMASALFRRTLLPDLMIQPFNRYLWCNGRPNIPWPNMMGLTVRISPIIFIFNGLSQKELITISWETWSETACRYKRIADVRSNSVRGVDQYTGPERDCFKGRTPGGNETRAGIDDQIEDMTERILPWLP